jgi:transcriptional regulator with XRE-family HTH domain
MERQPLKALIEYRVKQGWTPAELARFLEEHRPTVHRWETGARKIGRKKLEYVSEKTGIPKRELRPDLAEVMREST